MTDATWFIGKTIEDARYEYEGDNFDLADMMGIKLTFTDGSRVSLGGSWMQDGEPGIVIRVESGAR